MFSVMWIHTPMDPYHGCFSCRFISHPRIPCGPVRLERGNLFEDLCNLISKTACPVAKGALTSLHFISLEAMHAVMQASERGGRGRQGYLDFRIMGSNGSLSRFRSVI